MPAITQPHGWRLPLTPAPLVGIQVLALGALMDVRGFSVLQVLFPGASSSFTVEKHPMCARAACGGTCPATAVLGAPGSKSWAGWEHLVVPKAWQGQGWWPWQLDARCFRGGRGHQTPDLSLSLVQVREPISAVTQGWGHPGWPHRAGGCGGEPGGWLWCLHLCCFQPCQET